MPFYLITIVFFLFLDEGENSYIEELSQRKNMTYLYRSSIDVDYDFHCTGQGSNEKDSGLTNAFNYSVKNYSHQNLIHIILDYIIDEIGPDLLREYESLPDEVKLVISFPLDGNSESRIDVKSTIQINGKNINLSDHIDRLKLRLEDYYKRKLLPSFESSFLSNDLGSLVFNISWDYKSPSQAFENQASEN